MPQKPSRQVSPLATKVAEMMAAEMKARTGPSATFEEEQELAAAIAAEALAELTKREPKGGG